MASVHHMIHRLHPPILDDLGLVAALRAHVDAFGTRTGVACTLDAPAREPDVSGVERTAVFRVAQESLTNVARHASARHARVSVVEDADVLRLTVVDDGCGIAGAAPGFGVRGMSERATLLGGTLAVEPRPEGGTMVRLELPLTRRTE
jgi:two-component system sensor histidine kinase UhpB